MGIEIINGEARSLPQYFLDDVSQGNPIDFSKVLQAGREDLAVKLNNATCSCTLSNANWEINPLTEASLAVLSYRPLILNGLLIATAAL